MNEKNVDALEASLLNILPPGRLTADEVHLVALSMVNAGVLVPNTLSEDELMSCGKPESDLLTERAEVAPFVRERLERIAKGEPRPDAVAEPTRKAENMKGDPEGTAILRPLKDSDPS